MKKGIVIKLDGVLIDTREIFSELYNDKNNSNIKCLDFDYRKYFESNETFTEFFDFHGQQLYNNKNIFREELNELISIANECLFPVYIYQERYYLKQSYHIINLLARQKNLIISGFILDKNIEINKKEYYIYEENLIIDEEFNLYDNSLCNFFKKIEKDIKKELK